MAGRTPPRYVPTLTEVVQAPQPVARAPIINLSEEQLVHRVMQRIDLSLDRRLREAIATTVLEHTRLLGPLLREDIEAAVRQAVSQALAEELGVSAPPPKTE
jgi:hypothetical protein